MAGENEKNPDAQAKADAGHQKQAQRVAEIERKRQAEIEAEKARNRELSRKSRGYAGPSFGR